MRKKTPGSQVLPTSLTDYYPKRERKQYSHVVNNKNPSSAQCSVMTQRGGMGKALGRRLKKDGIYVYIQLIHFVVQQKLTQHCKAIILQWGGKKKEFYVLYHLQVQPLSC